MATIVNKSMLENTITLTNIADDSSVVFERTTNGPGTSTAFSNHAADIGKEETIKVDHRIVGKGDARVRQTRIRVDVNRVNAVTGKSGNINCSILINVPQSGLVIVDADVKQAVAYVSGLIRASSETVSEATVDDARVADVLIEGTL